MADDFALLETILYDPNEGFYLLDRHIARLLRSAVDFHTRDPSLFVTLPTAELVYDALQTQVPQTPTYKRVRLLLHQDTTITVEYTELDAATQEGGGGGIVALGEAGKAEPTLTVVLSKAPLACEPTDAFLQNKTTYRDMYNAARACAGVGHDGPFDVLLWNDKRQVTETSIANIAVRTVSKDGHTIWLTPKKECGLLPGVFREMLLAGGQITEGIITVDDLIRAQEEGQPIVCFNSVRKAYRVKLVDYQNN